MNTPHFTLSRGRAALFAFALAGSGALTWAAAGLADGATPKVSVKVDDKPVASSAQVATFAPVVKRVAPSVVKVQVTERAKNIPEAEMPQIFRDPMFRQFFGDQSVPGNSRRIQRQPAQEGLGSGVIVSSDGYILTNNHVVNGADTIKIAFNDGRELPAKIVGTDPQSDLAVVKVDAKDLPAITFANSDHSEVGDRVLAIGNPFGIGQTVTSGMVSGLSRTMPMLGLDYEDFIQTDAAINPGNSGGALVDVDGRLVGINTAILSRSGGFQGIGFAIPANLARNVMEQLVANGKVVRGFLGVSIQDITPDIAAQFDLKSNEGALIASVTPGSPAEKAGLQGGDVITKFGEKAVTDGRRLKLAVGNIAPGTEVKAEVLREGKVEKLTLKIGDQPRNGSLASRGKAGAQEQDEGTLNGVGVADLDTNARREFDIPARVRGAIVTEVDPDSAAAVAGLQPGDVIEEINRQPVRSAEDAVKLTEKSGNKKTLVRVWNPRGTRYVVVDETEADGRS